ncbi:anaerobic ribonucleoside-triphosphate reductase activating protein [Alkaliphilus sp. B6464]|uniref:anaerobic ribonucleoside-triphosphate reductase activating protein n=1 Tax=Alkaliphilus sp. B6464 TaxID=2731219 RepID=UPI001BA6F26C|nr:anaerobic ribonucleoside-triphosphate reductase activating protein [Alkaliphilus sp. B6464]QUH20165.1 anaerobic ribonucleoside-triphosphate reductase activating protein [Alkaliphilus sp. B6464]
MNIIGIEKSSFIDYPNNICTVLFTGGCNFRCPYCHNSSIVNNTGDKIDEEEIIDFLKKRKKFIDTLCISGGEPTLQKDLYDFICRVKEEGFIIKLDTNGTNPTILRNLIDKKLIDYVAMDIKAPLIKYPSIVKSFVDLNDIQESINILLKNKVDYEFRTTICKELLSIEDIETIAKELKGCKTYVLQNFRDGETVLAGKNRFTSYKAEELKEIEEAISSLLNKVVIR